MLTNLSANRQDRQADDTIIFWQWPLYFKTAVLTVVSSCVGGSCKYFTSIPNVDWLSSGGRAINSPTKYTHQCSTRLVSLSWSSSDQSQPSIIKILSEKWGRESCVSFYGAEAGSYCTNECSQQERAWERHCTTTCHSLSNIKILL